MSERELNRIEVLSQESQFRYRSQQLKPIDLGIETRSG